MELSSLRPDATTLDLSGKELTSLPEEFTRLTSLTTLDLSRSQLPSHSVGTLAEDIC